MKKRTNVYSETALLLILALTSACGFLFGSVQRRESGHVPDTIEQVAVLVMPQQNFPHELVEATVTRKVLGKHYRVPSRFHLKKVIDEIGLRGIVENPKRLTGKLEADSLFIVTMVGLEEINKEGKHLQEVVMNGRLVEVANGEVVWTVDVTDAAVVGVGRNKLFKSLASKLAGAMPNNRRVRRTRSPMKDRSPELELEAPPASLR